jgi:hypothetical protein
MQCRLKTDSDHLKVEEDKLKVVWHAAAIEKWLVGREQSFFITSTGHEICWISWFTVGMQLHITVLSRAINVYWCINVILRR